MSGLPYGLSSHGNKDPKEDPPVRKESTEPPDPGTGLVQRCVIIQKDEKGYGFTVSGDNPVHVASVKQDGAAMRAGVQQQDRIVKVNGTLVTSRNHLDVVKLIKSGSYVALTLLGKPNALGVTGVSVLGGPAKSPEVPGVQQPKTEPPGQTNRVTAPQPVDPDKDRELWQQKIHMTRTMFETAKEDYERIRYQYVGKPSEKLHASLLEKERTVKALDNQLKQLTGQEEVSSLSSSISSVSTDRFSYSEHSNTDTSSARPDSWAASLPSSTQELGSSMSDSPHTSPSVSPTPLDPHLQQNGQNMEDSITSAEIITIDDEDVQSEDDQPTKHTPPISTQVNDPGPFADISLLENKPAHMAILLNYLCANSDPAYVLFYIISDAYAKNSNSGNNKELRKWAYEIFSTFIVKNSPLCINTNDNLISSMDHVLVTSANRQDGDSSLKQVFHQARQGVMDNITDQLADFRSRNDMGMGNFYGLNKLQDNMDKVSEVKVAEEVLIHHIESVGLEDNNSRSVTDKNLATAWALATFLRSWVSTKSQHQSTLERVQTFMMKDKRYFKIPGSKSTKAKQIKGHQFTLQHFTSSTFCNVCGSLIWGVGYQGYQCQSCEMTLHKHCVEESTEICGGKKKRVSKLFPPVISSQKPGKGGVLDNLPGLGNRTSIHQDSRSPPAVADMSDGSIPTQPVPKEEDAELAGLPSGHSVKSIVNRYEMSPTGPGPGVIGLPDTGTGSNPDDRRGSSDLTRSGSLNNKEGQKSETRPTRRAKSSSFNNDVDVDSDTIKTISINQSESSSSSSMSKSMESPSESTENIYDSDLDVEPDLPSLQQVLGEDVLFKLKPKEKKRQEVINELFHTERAHLRNLKILDLLFNKPMAKASDPKDKPIRELATALFPNMEEMINLHESLVRDIKEKSQGPNPVVQEVGDILLARFDGEAGEKFRKGTAEYCRNQCYALDGLKKQQRRDTKLTQLLVEAHANTLCRRLELKDLVPSQMQRLTKYPLLIDNLLKYTPANSEEHKRLERAHERCKHVLAYVNQAVKECENFHKVREIFKKVDRKPFDNMSDPSLNEVKALPLANLKMTFDGPLTWKVRSHRSVDLHACLFEEWLVLLQKQDDKYILKCQNANPQSARDDHKFTHSPILRLKDLLCRNLATDKKTFFVVNMSSGSGAQMYEFSCVTTDSRKNWCNLINTRAEELKKSSNTVSRTASSIISAPHAEKMETERSKIRVNRKERSNSTALANLSISGVSGDRQIDSVDGLQISSESLETIGDSELIQPEEVSVSDAVTVEAVQVRSPLAMVSPGESSASEAESSSVTSQSQLAAGPASSPSPAPSSASSLNVPVPMEQLKAMAHDMNTILSRLMEAISSGSEERHRLRQDLADAQHKLDLLKDMQRQMMASEAAAPQPRQGRISPRPQPESGFSSVTATDSSDIPGHAPTQQQQQPEVMGREAVTGGEAGASSSETQGETEEGGEFVLAPEQQIVEQASTESQSSQVRIHRAGLQEATVTQLEESVLDLSTDQMDTRHMSLGDTLADQSVMDVELDNDMDEEDNEVSVADLPLPADKVPVSLDTVTDSLQPAQSGMQAEGDSETEESDDNDTLTSRHSHRDSIHGDPMAGGDTADIVTDMSRSSSVDPTEKPVATNISADRGDSLCHSDEATDPILI